MDILGRKGRREFEVIFTVDPLRVGVLDIQFGELGEVLFIKL